MSSSSSSSFRAVVAAVVTVSACVILATREAGAQTCSISSTARGPLACSVTTTVHMSLRVPAMVGVTMTAPSASAQVSRVVRAGLSVKTNRSYLLQIASAPAIAVDEPAARSAYPSRVTWTTPADRASLDETPTQIDANDGPSDDREPIEVAFVREPRPDVSVLDPIRLILTVVAP